MGILESVIGTMLGGNAGGVSSPMGGILTSLLGGGQQGSTMGGGLGGSSLGGGLGGGGLGGGSLGGGLGGGLGAGGLGGLLSQFQNAGLGHIAQSWVNQGPNQSISPDQLQNVFGQDRVNDMASQAGLQPGDFLSQLSQHLPNAVNGMTPNGRLPDEGTLSV